MDVVNAESKRTEDAQVARRVRRAVRVVRRALERALIVDGHGEDRELVRVDRVPRRVRAAHRRALHQLHAVPEPPVRRRRQPDRLAPEVQSLAEVQVLVRQRHRQVWQRCTRIHTVYQAEE